jgi:hypothetical protein
MCLIKYTQSAPLVSYMLPVKVSEHAYDCCCCSNQCWGSSSFFKLINYYFDFFIFLNENHQFQFFPTLEITDLILLI